MINLTDALKGIHLLPFSVKYKGTLESDNPIYEKAYILPVKTRKYNYGENCIREVGGYYAKCFVDLAFGIFNADGKVLDDSFIKFSHKRVDGEDIQTLTDSGYLSYCFKNSLDGRFYKFPEYVNSDSQLVIPIRATKFKETIGKEENDKWVVFEGSPFRVMGIDGFDGLHPIIVACETGFDIGDEIKLRGYYLGKDGGLDSYTILRKDYQDEEFLRQFLNDIKSGKKIAVSSNIFTGMVEEKKNDAKPEEKQNKENKLESIVHEETKVSTTSRVIKADHDINWEEPRSIVRYLDNYVIGQDDAKKVVAVSFSNYMMKFKTKNDKLNKSNMLLIGPSGVGKTYMISLLAKKAQFPFVQSKLTGKSTEGYKGENLSRVFDQIRQTTTEKDPYAVIFLDEIDKLAKDDWGSGSGFGSRIQDELIGWLEEAEVMSSDKPKNGEDYALNTKNILFVTAGAFQGAGNGNTLADIINERIGAKTRRQVGFVQESRNEQELVDEYKVLFKVTDKDLITYGLKRELVGRLPSMAVLDPLNTEQKVRILNEAKQSPLINYEELLRLKGFSLDLDNGVKELIAHLCPAETGARALNAVCNDLFTDILFEPEKFADDNKVIHVTPDLARKLINLYA